MADSVRSGSADIEGGAEFHSKVAATVVPELAAASSERPDGPCCGFCGSRDQHLSTRTGFRELAFKLLGAAVYRCDRCGHRFAFAPISRGLRRRRREPVEAGGRSGAWDDARQRGAGGRSG